MVLFVGLILGAMELRLMGKIGLTGRYVKSQKTFIMIVSVLEAIKISQKIVLILLTMVINFRTYHHLILLA